MSIEKELNDLLFALCATHGGDVQKACTVVMIAILGKFYSEDEARDFLKTMYKGVKEYKEKTGSII